MELQNILIAAVSLCVGIIGFFLRDMFQSRQQNNLAASINQLNLNVALLTQKIDGMGKEFVSNIDHNIIVNRIIRLEEQLNNLINNQE